MLAETLLVEKLCQRMGIEDWSENREAFEHPFISTLCSRMDANNPSSLGKACEKVGLTSPGLMQSNAFGTRERYSNGLLAVFALCSYEL